MEDRFRMRAWVKGFFGEKMMPVTDIAFPDYNKAPCVTVEDWTGGAPDHCFYSFDDVILMACTGLKDKNETLIYEGDIVKRSFSCFKVIWDKSRFALKDLTTGSIYGFIVEISEFETLGNVYENPELLED